MNIEDRIRAAVKEQVDNAIPPPPNIDAVLGRRPGPGWRAVAIPVAVVAIVGGIIGGAEVLTDEGTGSQRPQPLGALDYSDGLRAYMSPDDDGGIFLGGRRFDSSDLEDIDTDATATPYGMVYFDADARAYLLDEGGERTPIGPVPEEAPKAYHPSAKADVTRPLAAWTEYYGDHVTIRMYDLEAGEDVESYDVDCGDRCADVVLDAVDNGVAYVSAADGKYAWDPSGGTGEWTRVAGPKTDIVGVHNRTILYFGPEPAPDDGGPIDDSWRLVRGPQVDAELSHDGKNILYWSRTLRPTRDGGKTVRLDAPRGAYQFTFDTDGSVLVATSGAKTSQVYDCEVPSGTCSRLDDVPTENGDVIFLGNDM